MRWKRYHVTFLRTPYSKAVTLYCTNHVICTVEKYYVFIDVQLISKTSIILRKSEVAKIEVTSWKEVEMGLSVFFTPSDMRQILWYTISITISDYFYLHHVPILNPHRIPNKSQPLPARWRPLSFSLQFTTWSISVSVSSKSAFFIIAAASQRHFLNPFWASCKSSLPLPLDFHLYLAAPLVQAIPVFIFVCITSTTPLVFFWPFFSCISNLHLLFLFTHLATGLISFWGD